MKFDYDKILLFLIVLKHLILGVGFTWIVYRKKEPKVKRVFPVDRYANNVEMQITILKMKREYDKVILKYTNPILNFLAKMINKLKKK